MYARLVVCEGDGDEMGSVRCVLGGWGAGLGDGSQMGEMVVRRVC